MIMTNNFGIPNVIYARILESLNSDPYNFVDKAGDSFRTTSLLGPPLPNMLFQEYRHTEDLKVDASEFTSTVFGHVFHAMCQGKDDHNILYEHVVNREFKYKDKVIAIFGTIDELVSHKMSEGGGVPFTALEVIDNKTCLMSNLGYPKPEYADQLNMYLHLLRPSFQDCALDDTTVKLRLRYFIKDWTPTKRKNAIQRAAPNSPAHIKAMLLPKAAIHYEDVRIRSADFMDDFVQSRLKDHMEHSGRICTPDERWDTLPKVAVMLKGNKRAKKLCSTGDEAQKYMNTTLNEKDLARAYTEPRIPEKYERDKRCQYYCISRTVCPFAKEKGYV